MSNIFTQSKTKFSINIPSTNEYEDLLNGMYLVKLVVVFPFDKNKRKKHLDIPITFYVDQDNLPNYSFDSHLEDGFKTVLLNSMEETLNSIKYGNVGLAKLGRLSPKFYYSPLADDNTRKIYQNGVFNNISMKFRLYDTHYLQSTKDNITSQPMEAFGILSSCIFPNGVEGYGGTVEDIINSWINSAKDFAFGGKNEESIIKQGMHGIIDYVTNTTRDNGDKSNAEVFKDLRDALVRRSHGCPTIIFKQIGDRNFNHVNNFDNMEFFLTNINVTFSKDLIMDITTKQMSPIYIDFEITLSPTIIPSLETMEEWLFYDLLTEQEKGVIELNAKNNAGSNIQKQQNSKNIANKEINEINDLTKFYANNTLRKYIK